MYSLERKQKQNVNVISWVVPYNIVVRYVVSMVPLLDIVLISVDPILSVSTTGLVEGEIRTEESSNDGPSENGYRIGSHQFSNERHRAVLEHSHYILAHQIEIFLPHLRHLVFYFSRVMYHYESTFFSLWFLIKLIVFVDRIEFLQ